MEKEFAIIKEQQLQEGDGQMESLLTKIELAKEDMTAVEKKIADYILSHSTLIPNMTTKELAQKTDVSEASIVRFARVVGIDSFKAFKLALVKDLAVTETTLTDFNVLQQKDTPYDSFQKVIHVNKAAIEACAEAMDKRELEHAVDLFARANRVIFYGVGGSSTAAIDAQYKFTKLGYAATTSPDFHYMLSLIPHLGKSDVFVAISTSGRTKDVLELVRFAKKKRVPVIAITNLDKSPLYREADVRLCTPNVESDFRIASIASRMTQLTIVDTLYMGLLHRKGEGLIDRYAEARDEMVKLRR